MEDWHADSEHVEAEVAQGQHVEAESMAGSGVGGPSASVAKDGTPSAGRPSWSASVTYEVLDEVAQTSPQTLAGSSSVAAPSSATPEAAPDASSASMVTAAVQSPERAILPAEGRPSPDTPAAPHTERCAESPDHVVLDIGAVQATERSRRATLAAIPLYLAVLCTAALIFGTNSAAALFVVVLAMLSLGAYVLHYFYAWPGNAATWIPQPPGGVASKLGCWWRGTASREEAYELPVYFKSPSRSYNRKRGLWRLWWLRGGASQ